MGSVDDPACIEVYPHAATIGLFNLGRILKYNGAELATRQPAVNVLLDHVESNSTLRLGATSGGVTSGPSRLIRLGRFS